MTTLELIVRSGACTAALILAVALLRARHATLPSRLFGGALSLGVAAYLACSGSPSVCSGNWFSPALLLASGAPFFFWGWTTSIMDDDFAVSPFAVAAAVLLMGIGLGGAQARRTDWRSATVVLHSLLGLGFIVAALVTVLRGWRQDLLEARRRLRAIVLVLCGGYSMAVLTVELVLRAHPPSQELLLINAVLLAVLLFGLACGVLEVSAYVRSAFGWAPASAPPAVEPADVHTRNREQELIAKLQELMSQHAMHRDPSIAIASLAGRLGVPERKLRDAINRRLGFKNFPSYVNAFRVEEVRRRLSDPAQDDVPILTLALEAGFGSIVAFNRAFKDKYGLTPSTYRARRSLQTEEAKPSTVSELGES